MQSFLVHTPPGNSTAAASAVVFDSPHSGIILPKHFHYACTHHDLMHLHDPHVEKLLTTVPATGATVLESMIHRTCIDLNRYDDEIDPGMIDGTWPHTVRETFYTNKKLGLFPVFAGPRTKRISPIYNTHARITVAEAEHRINTYHRPYYATLHGLLHQARTHHGHAIHVNMHSFQRQDGMADIILGDGGDTGPLCAPNIKKTIQQQFENAGLNVDFNGTYFSGGALIHATSNIPARTHSIQIEIARDLYMDTHTLTFDPVRGAHLLQTLSEIALSLGAKNLTPARF